MSSTTTPAFAPLPRFPEGDLREEVRTLHRKIDRLTEQIGYLHDRTRAAMEFKDDLMPVAKDAVAALSEELQSVEQEFNSEEIAHLLRKVLRSTPRFVWALDQMETIGAFVDEFTPIARELMSSGIEWLDLAERQGYFRLARGATALADQVGEHYGQADIDALAASFPLILETLKRLTQPPALALASGAVDAIEALHKEKPEPLSPWGLLKAMREPEVQQGLGMAIDLLRRLSRQPPMLALPPAPAKRLSEK